MASSPDTLAALESRAASASTQCGRLLVDLQQLAFQIDRSLDDLRGQLKVLAELATDGFMELNRMCRLIAKANASSVSVDSRQRIHDAIHSSEDFLSNSAALFREALARSEATAADEAGNVVRAAEVWRVMIRVLDSSSTLLELRDQEEAQQLLDATAQDLVSFKDLLSRQAVAEPLPNAPPEQTDDAQSHDAPPSYNTQAEAAAGTAASTLDIKSRMPGLQAPVVGPLLSEQTPSVTLPSETTPVVADQDENEVDNRRGPMGFFRSLLANLKTVEPLLPALCSAAAAGQAAQVRALLQQGANVNGRNEKGNTPLISAVRAGQMEMVKLLVDNGADLQTEDTTQGIPPLFHAANAGRLDMVSLFIDLGADPGACNSHGSAYFNQTVEQAPLDVLQELLRYGASAESQSLSCKPVIAGVVEKGDVPRAKVLLDWGARVSSTTPWGDSLLFVAVKRKDMAMVRFLLDRGASPNSQSASGQCVLSGAVSEDLHDIASLLLERRAKVDGRNAADTPCLITAIQKDLIHMTHLLLKYKADPNTQDGMGRSAVQLAVQQNKLAHLHALLKHGAKADVYSLRDNPILTVAVTSNLPPRDLPEYIRLLAEHGASAHKTSSTGNPKPGDKKTPFALIVATGQLESVQALLDAGAIANLPPGQAMDDDSILEIAARTGKVQIVRAMLDAGVGTTQKALMYAYRAAKENMVLALEDQIRREAAAQLGQARDLPAGPAIPIRETPPPYTA